MSRVQRARAHRRTTVPWFTVSGRRIAVMGSVIAHRAWRVLNFLPELGIAAGFVVILLFGTIQAAGDQGDYARALNAGGVVLMVLAACSTVLLRRKSPVWALGGAITAVSTYLILGYPYGPVQLCMVVSMFEVARHLAPRRSLLVCGLAAVAASTTVLPRLVQEVGSPLLLALAWTAWIVLPWSLGALVHVVAAARERSRRELIARVALEERMRIAGEVHDVAGHGFSVVAMQAGVASLVFDEHPDQARESLQAIHDTSVRSLTELRSMLDTVHPDARKVARAEKVEASVPPAPPVDAGEPTTGLSGLDELVQKVRAGGLPVQLDVPDIDAAMSREVDQIAYRIVQESLTNVLRHAGPTEAGVRIARCDDGMLVQVRDRGSGASSVPAQEGRGLSGMRDRVEAVGGRFEAGPYEGGGFRVAAHLPLTAAVR